MASPPSSGTSAFHPNPRLLAQQVELWFSILYRKVIRHGIFTFVKALVQAIMTFIERFNQEGKPFTWTLTPERLKNIVITGTKQ